MALLHAAVHLERHLALCGIVVEDGRLTKAVVNARDEGVLAGPVFRECKKAVKVRNQVSHGTSDCSAHIIDAVDAIEKACRALLRHLYGASIEEHGGSLTSKRAPGHGTNNRSGPSRTTHKTRGDRPARALTPLVDPFRGSLEQDRAALRAATDKTNLIWLRTAQFTIDTVVGLYTFLMVMMKLRLGDVRGFRLIVDEHAVPSNITPLDLDALIPCTYRERGIGSATEALLIDGSRAVDFIVRVSDDGDRVEDCSIPWVMPVLSILARNNETAYLETPDYPLSFAWLLQSIEYAPGRCDDSFDWEYHGGLWLAQLMCMLQVVTKALAEDIEPDLEGFRALYPEIIRTLSFGEKAVGENEHLLTVPGYLVAMHTLGYMSEDIEDEFREYQRAFDAVLRIDPKDRPIPLSELPT